MRLAARHALRTGLAARWLALLIAMTMLPPLAGLCRCAHQCVANGNDPACASSRARARLQPAAIPPPRQLTVFEQQAAETIKITNAFRRRNGLPEFKEDPVCSAAAFDHAQDMARQSYFDHFGPGGTSPTSRYKRRNTSGQRVIRVTENIARATEPPPRARCGCGSTPRVTANIWWERK